MRCRTRRHCGSGGYSAGQRRFVKSRANRFEEVSACPTRSAALTVPGIAGPRCPARPAYFFCWSSPGGCRSQGWLEPSGGHRSRRADTAGSAAMLLERMEQDQGGANGGSLTPRADPHHAARAVAGLAVPTALRCKLGTRRLRIVVDAAVRPPKAALSSSELTE